MKKAILQNLTLALFITVLASAAISLGSEGVPPIADAGLSRYAAQDPVVLDGTGSYDLDNSGTLSYSWHHISGPTVVISDADTATLTISGFIQTDAIQECEFELVVSDGELTSLPDTVKVIIVPDFGADTLRQENPPFDRNEPTLIYFGGGNCVTGSGSWGSTAWVEKANIISFTNYGPDPNYTPGNVNDPRTYYRYGDIIIVYLSSVAPDYKQPIQTSGYSTGGQPAIDVGIHLNQIYADARYAVNRVTFLDARACRDFSDSIIQFLASSVDGEQCWIDNYRGNTCGPYPCWPSFYPNVLRGGSSLSHASVQNWYRNSLAGSDMNQFNNGVIAGAYWSVIGPGKNLQLASTPDTLTYTFQWYGSSSSGYMDYYDESNHPGRLPEPVTLVGPANGALVDANGAVLSCEESENAVGYQLLFGRDPYHMVYLFSDTPSPPDESVTNFPFEQCWWTVRAYDEYGSTIHADPVHIKAKSVIAQTIENATTGQTYASIQQAINDAHPGDEIVVSPGIYQYLENINFKGKNIILRSTDPNDPAVVAATVINGGSRGPVVTFSAGEKESCVLNGLTIASGIVGISCHDALPTIRNCTVGRTGAVAIKFWGSAPRLIDCTILGEVVDHALLAHWKLDEIEGDIASDSANDNDGTVYGDPTCQPEGGMVNGALQLDGIADYVNTPFVLNPADGKFSVFVWIKGGAPGQTVLSQIGGVNWLCADTLEGNLMTELKALGRGAAILPSQAVITDGDWHRIGLVWDGSIRTLYVDDVAVAEDEQTNLEGSDNGLYIGAGTAMEPGSFWSGLIDDVRIYNRAVTP